jgi:hypothetical protein
VAIALATIAALRRPQLAARLPFGGLGVGLAYFAAAVALEVRIQARLVGGFTGHPQASPASWAYGFYIGLASAAVAGICGLALGWSDHRTRHGSADTIAGFIGIALLASLLLPWLGYLGPSFSYPGIVSPAAAIATLGLILGARWVHREAGRRWRLPLAIATAILIGGAASGITVNGDRRYGTWIGIGCALLLVVLEAARASPLLLPALPRGLAAWRVGAAALLIVALFLPWQKVESFTTTGWYLSAGAAAGALCLLLLARPTLPVIADYDLEVVVAITLFVSMLGAAFRRDPVFHVGYGAFVGVAAAGILLVSALVHFRPGRIERRRALARAVPLIASVLCVAAVVVPYWFVVPRDWDYQAAPLLSWMAVPGLLLGLYLARLWVLRIRGTAVTGYRLTLVPGALLTLASLELIRLRNDEVIWGAVILVGLCILLVAFGWIEEHRGLDSLRVPEEIWRVDRLPEAES